MPRCKNCKEKFEAKVFNQKYCLLNEDCVKVWNEARKATAWKAKKKKMKASLLTVQEQVIITQRTFNKWIRQRDKGNNCISCNKPAKKENAGHFYNSNNHWSVRFNEDNVHLQCEYCNTYLSGNLIEYRINLIAKIGEERFNALERLKNETKNFTVQELIEINNEYKRKLK